MDERTMIVACIAGLLVVVLILTAGLVTTSIRLSRSHDRLTDAVIAESCGYREIRRIESESAHQEFLLREAREKAARLAHEPRPAMPEGSPDIMVSTRNGTLDQ